MIKKDRPDKEMDELRKKRMAAAIFSALVQHGTIQLKRPKNIFIKKDSEWKKRRISGLR